MREPAWIACSEIGCENGLTVDARHAANFECREWHCQEHDRKDNRMNDWIHDIPSSLLYEDKTTGLRDWLLHRGRTLSLLELETERKRRHEAARRKR